MANIGLQGGAGLEEHLKRIAAKVGNATEVRVGFPAGSTEKDGTSLPMIAAIQEFGAPAAGIQPRPFMRTAIAQHKGEWGDQLAEQLVAHDYDTSVALGEMGLVIAGEIVQSIIDLTSPALSPVTVMLRSMRTGRQDDPVTFAMVQEARRRVAAGEAPKGMTATGAKPLIDSGTLLNSVTSEVVDSE